jgi:hypothetical protein
LAKDVCNTPRHVLDALPAQFHLDPSRRGSIKASANDLGSCCEVVSAPKKQLASGIRLSPSSNAPVDPSWVADMDALPSVSTLLAPVECTSFDSTLTPQHFEDLFSIHSMLDNDIGLCPELPPSFCSSTEPATECLVVKEARRRLQEMVPAATCTTASSSVFHSGLPELDFNPVPRRLQHSSIVLRHEVQAQHEVHASRTSYNITNAAKNVKGQGGCSQDLQSPVDSFPPSLKVEHLEVETSLFISPGL